MAGRGPLLHKDKDGVGLPIPFILSENCLWLDRIPSGQPHPLSCENG
jgi:hypothetical protein